MKFLKFADQAAYEVAFAQYLHTDEENVKHAPSYIDGVAIDVVGIIYEESGEFQTVEIEGSEPIQVPVMVPVEGFHVNLSGPLAQFAEFEVPTPETPYRVFAGWNDAPEPDRVPTQVPRWAAVLALKSNPSPVVEGESYWDNVVAIRNQIIAHPNDTTIVFGGNSLEVTADLKNRIVAALDDANYWERHSELVNFMATLIGLDQAGVDALFIWAGKQQM